MFFFTDIFLIWNLALNNNTASVTKYELYVYCESNAGQFPRTEHWQKFGDAAAIPLPMGCQIGEVNIHLKCFNLLT